MITLGSKFNRSYSLNLMFNKEWCNLDIIFNKNNLYTAFQIDQKSYVKNIKNGCSALIFFDIKKSTFCNTFLDTSDVKTSNLDIKNQFNSVYTQYKDMIKFELNETIKLSKISTGHGFLENLINIHVFRFNVLEDSFLYCLVERQYIDMVVQKKIVRTSAYQLQTKEASEYLSAAVSKYQINKNIMTPEQAIQSVFMDDISPQKKRGGIL